jgi:hypothetical protein
MLVGRKRENKRKIKNDRKRKQVPRKPRRLVYLPPPPFMGNNSQ